MRSSGPPLLLWDASALAKRYIPESGSATVDALFAVVPRQRMVGTTLGFAETHSTLLRSRNRGNISLTAFPTAKAALRNEVVNDPDFVLLTVDDAAVFDGVPLMERYNLNATDAAILARYLRHVGGRPVGLSRCALVAADHRLLTGALAEGLKVLDPTTVAPADVPHVLASL